MRDWLIVRITCSENAPSGTLGVLLVHGQRHEKLVVGKDGNLAEIVVVLRAQEAVREPIGKAEVDSFIKIETVVESSVVGAWASDDEFVGTLIADICPNSSSLESTR